MYIYINFITQTSELRRNNLIFYTDVIAYCVDCGMKTNNKNVEKEGEG